MFNFIFPKFHFEIERWKFNKNLKLYVSNLGRIKDENRKDLKILVDSGGYERISVCNNKKGVVKHLLVHRVVMETWCPKENMWKDKLTVDHLDHNKRNNKVKNLEWVTGQENIRRAKEDFFHDDKDITIQRLKDKMRNLEEKYKSDMINNEDVIIIANNNHTFLNWNEVYNWLLTVQPNIKGMKITNMINKIKKCSLDGHKKYCGVTWNVQKGG